MDDLKTIIDRIRKPLDFAARDNFAHVKSLADMEPFIRAQAEELRQVTARHDDVTEIENLFTGFDSITLDQKKERILKASILIAAIEHRYESAVHDRQTSSSEHVALHPSPRNSTATLLQLDTPVQDCKGIRAQGAGLLKKLGISTVEDALSYLPRRYEDRGNLKKIGWLTLGTYETVSGEVVSAEVV